MRLVIRNPKLESFMPVLLDIEIKSIQIIKTGLGMKGMQVIEACECYSDCRQYMIVIETPEYSEIDEDVIKNKEDHDFKQGVINLLEDLIKAITTKKVGV